MNNSTEIVIILDRSGSMQSIKKDMEGAFDAFIKDQQALKEECRVSLIQFDNTVQTVYENVNLDDVKPLIIEPRGGTALLDAVGTTINAVGQRLAAMSEATRPTKVLVAIITDGEENASHEFTYEKIKAMVDHQTQKYNWQFAYMGANQDAFRVGGYMGISSNAIINYQSTMDSVDLTTKSLSASTRAYRSNVVGASFNFSPDAVGVSTGATPVVPSPKVSNSSSKTVTKSATVVSAVPGPLKPKKRTPIKKKA